MDGVTRNLPPHPARRGLAWPSADAASRSPAAGHTRPGRRRFGAPDRPIQPVGSRACSSSTWSRSATRRVVLIELAPHRLCRRCAQMRRCGRQESPRDRDIKSAERASRRVPEQSEQPHTPTRQHAARLPDAERARRRVRRHHDRVPAALYEARALSEARRSRAGFALTSEPFDGRGLDAVAAPEVLIPARLDITWHGQRADRPGGAVVVACAPLGSAVQYSRSMRMPGWGTG